MQIAPKKSFCPPVLAEPASLFFQEGLLFQLLLDTRRRRRATLGCYADRAKRHNSVIYFEVIRVSICFPQFPLSSSSPDAHKHLSESASEGYLLR
ncbi:hypothetical protein CDAR_43651 [Caerostris darwini]|uniref:Uncharacterized protein n=1 Tax=Caerostris darwini TaxID=1538125 RepID=A0AAV4WIT6_9ARAC|nr:hypothetical protein CDAR_43651 [Caerostris darwini]